MAIHKVIEFSCTAAQLWEIVGTPDRVDWVPGVEILDHDGGCQMHWQTEVEPFAFESFIEDSMDGAIQQLHRLLD